MAFAAMSNWPWELDGALAERLLKTGCHVAIYGHFIPAGTRLLTPELAGQVTYDSNFYGVERGLEPMGNVHYAPSNLSQTPAWLLARRPRVAALTCSLPDENGWMSRSLWGTALSRRVLEQCEVVLVEVNPRMPNIPSDGEAHTRLHVSEVDGIIESSRPLVETPIAEGNETDSRIAGYIADLVPDGACIQLGLGGLANTVGECLAHAGKRDLGVHTEILSTGVMELMRRGVVNNSRKQTCPGRSVYANLVGGPELWAFANENPAFCQKEKIQIGILTVPASAAQGCLNALVEGGVRAVWNFAPVHLTAPEGVLVQRENMASSLALLSYHLKQAERPAENGSVQPRGARPRIADEKTKNGGSRHG